MKAYSFTIHLEPCEEGGYTVTVPALPGCVTQGDTYEEAVAKAEECLQGYLEALVKLGKTIPTEPEPTMPSDVRIRIEAPALV